MVESRGLIDGFATHFRHFDGAKRFTGPSVYFHRKTIAMRWEFSSVQKAVENDLFIERLYTTLTSWGMYQTGRADTRLAEFTSFAETLREQAPGLEPLRDIRLENLKPDDCPALGQQLFTANSVGVKQIAARARLQSDPPSVAATSGTSRS